MHEAAAHQRALALYSGKAWVYAEELDVDILGADNGMSYYLEWIQARFMELEMPKMSQMMTELFRRCRRKPDQPVREFNMQFERLVLRLHEVRCELPPLVKAWLYVDKLRLTEAEELALLASVGNEYDLKKLQTAAIIQDRGGRRGGSEAAGPSSTKTGPWKGSRWNGGRQSAHVYHDGGGR